jgi:hypothetical protein
LITNTSMSGSEPKLTLGKPTGGSQFGAVNADMSMLATLVDMGFDIRKAELALIGVNNQSIDLAINYIYNNISELEEQIAPNTDVPISNSSPSFVSTAVMAPTNMPTIMEEHKKLVKGGLVGDSAEQKENFRRKLLEQEAAKREKERREKNQALKEIRRKMKQEKEERQERLNKRLQETSVVVKPYQLSATSKLSESTKGSSSEGTPSKPSSSTQSSSVKECVIQIRLPEGTMLKATLQSTQTLADLVAFIIQSRIDEEQTGEEFSLLIPFPRKEYMPEDFASTTIEQAGLAPRGSLTVQQLKSKGIVIKGQVGIHMDTRDDNEDDDNHMHYPAAPTIPYHRPLHISDDVIPVEGDEQKRTSALLCSQQWLHSREEQNEDNVIVYRPSMYKFPQTLSGAVKQRSGMNFLPSGSYSESRITINGQSSHVGTWKLRYDRSNQEITIELNAANEAPKIFRIAALSDEVLALIPVQ